MSPTGRCAEPTPRRAGSPIGRPIAEHCDLHPRRARRAGAARRGGRALHRRRRGGARLSQPPGADGGALRAPIRSAARPARGMYRTGDLGALAGRTATSSSSAATTTRSRSAASASSSARSRRGCSAHAGGRARRWCWRARTAPGEQAAGRLSCAARGAREPVAARAARASGASAAGVHGAGGVRAARGAAADAQRQARPQGAAGAGGRCLCARRLRGAAWASRGDAGRDLGGAARRRARRPARQLLRARRPLAAGGQGDRAAAATALGVELPLPTVRGAGAVRPSPRSVAAGAQRAATAADRAGRARDGALPLSFAQQRLWFLRSWTGRAQAYHMPAGVRLDGPSGPRRRWRGALDRDRAPPRGAAHALRCDRWRAGPA